MQRGIPRHMLSSVSISAPHEIQPIRSLDSMEVEQLTQEKLEASRKAYNARMDGAWKDEPKNNKEA